MTTNNIERTKAFASRFDALDGRMRAQVHARITAMEAGNFGDHHAITEGHGVWELRFLGKGPGHRVYYMRRGAVLYLLLGGGDKSTQQTDIANAVSMAKKLTAKLPTGATK